MTVYNLLGLDALDCPVAIIKNVTSGKMGKKDIIKVDADIELNLDILGYVDPGITVNYIKDSKLVEKKSIELPESLVNVVRCKNPVASPRQSRSSTTYSSSPTAKREYTDASIARRRRNKRKRTERVCSVRFVCIFVF